MSENNKSADLLGVGANRLTDKPLSRFRKRYRNIDELELTYLYAIKDTAAKLEYLSNNLKSSAELTLGLRRLEEAVFWFVKDVTGDKIFSNESERQHVRDRMQKALTQLPNITAD